MFCSWRDTSSYRNNAWVCCASGNVLSNFVVTDFYALFNITSKKSAKKIYKTVIQKMYKVPLGGLKVPGLSPIRESSPSPTRLFLSFSNFDFHSDYKRIVSNQTFKYCAPMGPKAVRGPSGPPKDRFKLKMALNICFFLY